MSFIKDVRSMHRIQSFYLILSFQDSHFIHCVKPNENKRFNEFDEIFVSNQLNVMRVTPLLDLLRHGYAERIPYDPILSKILPFITNKAKLYPEDLIGNVLQTIGCRKNKFKLGRTQIFFRPNQEQFIDYLTALKDDDAARLGSDMSKLFCTRQKNAWLIFCRFLGKCWCIIALTSHYFLLYVVICVFFLISVD